MLLKEMELEQNYQHCNQSAGCSVDYLYLLHQSGLEKWNWGLEWRERHVLCTIHQEKVDIHGEEGVEPFVVKAECHSLALEQHSGL
jgi:hypothetical protein